MAKSNFIVRGGANFNPLYQELNNAQKKLNGFKTGIGNTLKGVGALFGGIAVGRTVKDFVSTAMRTETMAVAMNSVARASGYATSALSEHKKAVMDMGIAEQESMQILTRFMQAQLDTAEASRLARVAQDAAVIANMNSSEAAEQMTEAIAKQRPELLSAFGMTKNMNEIYKDFAKTIGKTTKQLTNADKKQAMLNYIISEGNKIAGTYEASMGVVGKKISSLPRYWDTLKNAIATPLALPGLGVAVENITNSLKNATAWAENNSVTLQRWGYTLQGIVSGVTNAFGFLTQSIANNWNVIRATASGLLTYAFAAKVVAEATKAWRIINLALQGSLLQKIPILSGVSTAIGMYRVQMHLAAASGVALTGVLAKLRVALFVVNSLLGPVGWAVLGVSAAVGIGTSLWSRYGKSLDKVNEANKQLVFGDFHKAQQDMPNTAKASTNAIKDQADAIEKAGKAAKGSVAGFDEINQLADNIDSDSGAGIDIPGLDLAGMDIGEGLEDLKPTLKGFWGWIKQGVANMWGGVKENWNKFWGWVKSWGLWQWFADKWGDLKNVVAAFWGGLANIVATALSGVISVNQTILRELWSLLQSYWGNIVTLAVGLFGSVYDYIIGTWENIRRTTSTIWGAIWGFLKGQWNTITTFGGDIFGTLRDLVLGKIDLRTAVSQIWGAITTFFSDTWGNIKTLGETIWKGLKSFFITQWNLIKTQASTIWEAIKTFFVDNWEATKTSANNIWGAVETFFLDTWDAIKNTTIELWTEVLGFLGINWNQIKEKASEVWEGVKSIIVGLTTNIRDQIVNVWSETKDRLIDFWEGIKQGAKDKWDGVKDVIKNAINGIIGLINRLIEQWNSLKFEVPSVNIGGKTFGGYTIGVPQIPPITPLAKGGITNGPMLAMVGDNPGGREVVSPLDDLMDMISSAVGNAVVAAMQFTSGNQQGDVVIQLDGTTLARVLNPYSTKETSRIGPAMIKEG